MTDLSLLLKPKVRMTVRFPRMARRKMMTYSGSVTSNPMLLELVGKPGTVVAFRVDLDVCKMSDDCRGKAEGCRRRASRSSMGAGVEGDKG